MVGFFMDIYQKNIDFLKDNGLLDVSDLDLVVEYNNPKIKKLESIERTIKAYHQKKGIIFYVIDDTVVLIESSTDIKKSINENYIRALEENNLGNQDEEKSIFFNSIKSKIVQIFAIETVETKDLKLLEYIYKSYYKPKYDRYIERYQEEKEKHLEKLEKLKEDIFTGKFNKK